MRTTLLSDVVLAVAALGSQGACFRVEQQRPNVLLIVLDTTRRDRLSLYGYARETSPCLAALAREAAVFTQAYSTSSWTSSAHASLFTGLYPAAHHVTQEAWSMPEQLFTLAEAFSICGYRTAGIVGNPMVGRALGFSQGFQSFLETWREK